MPITLGLVIPPPGPDGFWHFLYKTTDLLTDQWYGGKRSTRKHPLADTYKGSGDWVKEHPARWELKRVIHSFHAGSLAVFEAETKFVTWADVTGDPLCMNRVAGGRGMSVEGARRLHADPSFSAQNAENNRRTASSPEWRAKNAANNKAIVRTPGWQAAHAAGIAQSQARKAAKAAAERDSLFDQADDFAGSGSVSK